MRSRFLALTARGHVNRCTCPWSARVGWSLHQNGVQNLLMEAAAHMAPAAEEKFIVRRCKNRKCRLLATHPARLWLNQNGVPRVTVMCLKCRSEERRVGKECRSRWSPYPHK